MSDERDERVGLAMRGLETPEHDAGFWVRLEQELGTHPAGPLRARRRRRRARVLASGALAGVLLVLALMLADDRPGPSQASAAEVSARVIHALGAIRALSGEVITTADNDEGGGRFTVRSSFLLTAGGDLRATQRVGRRGRDVQVFGAARGEFRELTVNPDGAPPYVSAFRQTGVVQGGPDEGGPTDVLARDLGAAVLALAAARDRSVSATTLRGRGAWRLVTSARLAPTLTVGLEAIVDRATALPIQLTLTRAGRTISRTRLSALVVNPRVPTDAFTVRFPPNVRVERDDRGFRTTPLRAVPPVAGYRPLLPASPPDGFVLQRVAVAHRPPPTGVRLDNPVAGPATVLAYVRGLRRVVVTLRPTGPRPAAWHDPFVPQGAPPPTQGVRLRRGALAGALAQVVIDPLAPPHLWVVGPRLVVTVSGSLSRAELVALAESLR